MFRRPLLRLLLGATLALAACNSDSSNSGDDSPPGTPDAAVATDGAVPGPDAFVPPADSYSLTWGPVTVQPGEEDTRCVTLRLNNAGSIHVGTIHNELTEGSHHLIVYRTSETTESTTPTHCDPFVGTIDTSKGSPLMITQKRSEVLELPAGVAFTFQAQQMIKLEMHFINTGDVPMDVRATSTFIPMAEQDFHDEADFLFIGNPIITLPAAEATTIGPAFFKPPAQFADVNFFALTGHTHHLGTNVHIATSTGSGDPGTPVYEHTNWLWNEPETSKFSPPFTLPTNGGFRFSCDYDNTSSATVHFGESANDEMCFFWAYYYPSKGAQVCVQTSQGGGCCPDSPFICQLMNQFLSSAP